MAGVALAGAIVPAAYYGHRELTRKDEDPQTPGEASVELADTATQHLANRLRGIWSLRLQGADADLLGLPVEGLELFIDIAARGRGVRGCLDSAERLRSDDAPRYRLIGDLLQVEPNRLYWRLVADGASAGQARYELAITVDEVWAAYGNAGSDTLSGKVVDLDRPLALAEQDSRFVAVKQRFPEARERTGLNAPLLAWLVSAEHRLFHQLWHATRDKWHSLHDERRHAPPGLACQPGHRDP